MSNFDEVREKWGNTQEFVECTKKLKDKTELEKDFLAANLMNKFISFGEIKESDPSSQEAKAAVEDLQKYITNNFYTCSNEILLSLGQMYVGDERFKENIDGVGGEGTAAFVNKAIIEYCK